MDTSCSRSKGDNVAAQTKSNRNQTRSHTPSQLRVHPMRRLGKPDSEVEVADIKCNRLFISTTLVDYQLDGYVPLYFERKMQGIDGKVHAQLITPKTFYFVY